MLTRRNFLTCLAAGPAMLHTAYAATQQGKVVLYATLDKEIAHYDIDVSGASLSKRGSILLPACVEFAWFHASRRFLYAACSDYHQDPKTRQHYLVALRIDEHSGALSMHGKPLQLTNRPIHMSTDIPSRHILVAYSVPSDLQVFRVNDDFTIGAQIPQPGLTDKGFYAHQVRVTPDNKRLILVTRGSNATPTKPEDPGALKIFDYNDGVLSNEFSYAPNGGIGFGPRNLDFHPTKPWAYISLERQNQLFMIKLDALNRPGATYQKDTLSEPGNLRPLQLAGTIDMHPSGKFVYVTNRAQGRVDFNGQEVSAGGENSIAVFSIDQQTGEPTLIQLADPQKFYPRTIDTDPNAQIAIVQSTVSMPVRAGDKIRTVPAGLSVFRIDADGKLALQRSYDILEYSRDTALWMGITRL